MANKNGIRFGIFSKVLTLMVLVAVLPLVTIWYVNYLNTMDRIGDQVHRQFGDGLGHLTSFVDNWVGMNARMLRQNASLPDMQSMDADRQNPLLQLITREYTWNYLAFTVDPQGQNVGRSDGGEQKFYGDRIYVKQVFAGKPLGKQVLIGKTSGKPAFVLAVPIKSNAGGLKGALAIAMTITELSEQITATKIGESGFAFLVDEEGKVIAHPNEELTSSRQNLSDNPAVAAALLDDKDTLIYEDTDGRKVIAHMARTGEGWLMVMQQDYDEAFRAVDDTNRSALVLLVVTLVLVILIAVLFSRRISVPILRLTEVAEALSRGKLDVVIEGRERSDEIGLLANAIGRLGTSIRLAMERLSRKTTRGA